MASESVPIIFIPIPMLGCSCQHSLHGCCPDGATPASGPSAGGCGCEASQFGCCPDGVTEASGKFLNGCEAAPEELRIPGGKGEGSR